MANRKEVLYKDFRGRLAPRPFWNSSVNGTYRRKPLTTRRKHRLTEAEDNAEGRRLRRRSNKILRGWLPFAKR